MFVSKASYYRHLSTHIEQQQQAIQSQIGSDAVALHWLDNYCKFYKASGMYTDKHLLQDTLWTAHGVKMLPSQVSLHWSMTPDGSGTIAAWPHLDQLLSNPCHAGLLSSLRNVSYNHYMNSIVVTRDVRRIPLKLDFKTAIDPNEANHLTASFDGLSYFYPVDIYPENITSHEGLLTASEAPAVRRIWCGRSSPIWFLFFATCGCQNLLESTKVYV